MIKTRQDLKEYIKADYERQNMKYPVIARFTWGEHYRTRRYLENLRHLEFYLNKKRRIWDYIPLGYYWLQHRRLSLKFNIYILPNTCGPGLLLPHPGFIRVGSLVRMGKNCTILPNVLFGNKLPVKGLYITVGDNCYFGTGCTVLGSCHIGNNVTVAAGAVVIDDVPDNAVVGGVPAKVLKIQQHII